MPQLAIYNNIESQYIAVCSFAVEIVDNEALEKVIPKKDGVMVPYIRCETFPMKYTYTYRLNETTLELEQVREKLHELKKSEWRQKRVPLLTKYDVAFMRALEIGDQEKINEIKVIKQQLRDITDVNIDHLSNAELEDYAPELLLTL